MSRATTTRHEKVRRKVTELSAVFAEERQERQTRRHLVKSDFDALVEAGFLLTGVPEHQGGLWEDRRSTRPIAEILRVIARGDPSVALVASMHPGVLAIWLATDQVPEAFAADWREQQLEVTSSALEGHWWGTLTSEPGSGGDIFSTRAVASNSNAGWSISGQKHFGSGSGITSFMITTAVPEREDAPDVFYLDVRDALWDGSTGISLAQEWDGHGMIATQSHAFSLTGASAHRVAWPGGLEVLGHNINPFAHCIFTAVIVGVVEEAIDTARSQLRRRTGLRPYEEVQWTCAETESFAAQQTYEGMLRAVESKRSPHRSVLLGKTAVAELSESVLRRLCRIMGGGTYSRQSPFGFWFEDVRALGFLRPPWALATDSLLESLVDDEDVVGAEKPEPPPRGTRLQA